MMKKLFLMLVCGLFGLNSFCQVALMEADGMAEGGCSTLPFMQKLTPDGERGFVIKGEIRNSKDGMKVVLLNDLAWPAQVGDSTVIKDGKFELSGYVYNPLLVKIVIDSKPGDKDEFGLLATAFFLENSDITYTGDVNTLETYFYNPDAKGKVPAKVTGSKENDLYLRYQEEEKVLKDRYRELNDKCYDLYESGQMEEAVRVSKQVNEAENAIRSLRLKYIKQYPGSGLANEQLGWLIHTTIYMDFTAKQLDQLKSLMINANPQRAGELEKMFARAKQTALGEKYSDLDLMLPDGKMVKLSEFIPKGKYVLLDFWFSGCGPCRAEIPHLKQVYEQYKDKDFTIVSIAAEPNKSDWLKALKEENMPWAQLFDGDPTVYDGPTCVKYNIGGFPTAILLDKEGRFFKTNMRGVNLDIVLKELFGVPSK